MICKSQWVEQTEKAFEQTILNKDKIDKVNTGSKNNSFLFPTLTIQLYFLLCCANWPFHSFFFQLFSWTSEGKSVDSAGRTPQSCEILQRFVWGGGREQTCPWLRCQQSRVKCFLLMDFFAMLQVWLNYINYILYGNKNIYFYLKAAGAML